MSSRHAPPMFVDVDNQAQALRRVVLGQNPEEDGKRREAFIQNLIHDHPTLIPMAEIEPAFSPLISVCKELPTPAGDVDNLWITPWVGIVLGEAKLVRNPQARREVVAQILDYARAFTGWGFDDFQSAVRKALAKPDLRLWDLVAEASDLDESQFVDAIERRLRTGRLMLLIIGDGIQEGVEALTAHLQLHAGLHVGLALLDLSLWRDVNGGLIVVPRVPMKTVLIERGIVRIDATSSRIDPPATPFAPAKPKTAAIPKTSTQSEGEFLEHMQAKRPDAVAPLQNFLGSLAEIGVTPEFGKTAKIIFYTADDSSAHAGTVEPNGKVWFASVTKAAAAMGRPEAAAKYLAAVAALIGGQVRQYQKSPPEVLDSAGHALDVLALVAKQDGWKLAISEFVEALRAD